MLLLGFSVNPHYDLQHDSTTLCEIDALSRGSLQSSEIDSTDDKHLAWSARHTRKSISDVFLKFFLFPFLSRYMFSRKDKSELYQSASMCVSAFDAPSHGEGSLG